MPTTYSGRKPLGALDQRRIVADDDLRHAVPIAQIDEHQRAEIAHAVHPAEQDDVGAGVARGQCAAGVRPCKCAKGDNVHHRQSLVVSR